MAFDLPVGFRRIYSGPIESTERFTSVGELNSYLNNPARYAGQLVTLVANNEVHLYILDAIKDSWIEVKTISDVNSVNGLTGIVVLDTDDIDDTNSAHKFVTQAQKDNFHVHSNLSILNATEEIFTTELLNAINNNNSIIDGGVF